MIVDLMALSPVLIVVTKPFSVGTMVVMFGLRTMFVVIHTLAELVSASIILHVNMFHKSIIWIIALLSLPLRVLTALQKERQLQEHLHEMTIMLDNLLRDRKELQGKLHTAIKECRTLESMLAEVEDENDKIISKFELLEGEVQGLKLENIQLKKILQKEDWRFKGQVDPVSLKNVGSGDSDRKQSFYKDTLESEGKRKAEIFSFSNTGGITGGPTVSFSHCTVTKSLETRKSPYQRREAALQSLFSALLSLLVGYIVWEAQDPCMPLTLALLVVVGMSLKSVFQFLSSVENKPASDAVALLSINWFILGTLTYPALPTVARVFASFL